MNMTENNKYDIFISWSKDDNDVGRRIANRLKDFISDVFSSFVDALYCVEEFHHLTRFLLY